jgi:two-component system sensor histidine kinase UhpB
MSDSISNEATLQGFIKRYRGRHRELHELARWEAWPDKSRLGMLFFATVVALSYYVATKIGLAFTPQERPISTFWPANAMLLASLLLAPKRRWWSLLLAVFPAHLAAQLQAGIPVTLATGWFIGNSAEALLGAACIRYFLKREQLFETVRGLVIFLVFGVIVAPLTTTFLDAAVVVITGNGSNYWPVWAARLFSNMLAEVTLVPIIVLSGLHGMAWVRRASLARYAEGAVLALMIVLVSIFVFGMEPSPHGSLLPLLYLPLPFLLWASVRYGLGGMCAALLALSVISIWNVMHGRGPFTTAAMDQNVLSLQVLLLVISLPLMLLTAFIREHRRLEQTLCEATGKLIDAGERNRREFAEELRTVIGERLAPLARELDGIKAEPAVRPRLEQLSARVCQVSAATQKLTEKIYLSQLERLGIAETVRDLCEMTKREVADLEVDFIQEELPDDLPPKVSLCVYRVAEEALRNLAKHSRAHKAVVELKVRRQHILLRIVDDGVGWSPKDQAAGLGLTNMRERARAMGGVIEIISRPLRGTLIELSLPLKLPNDHR